MDQDKVVKDIRKILTQFITDNFNVNMAMLLKDINADTYTFLLSAKDLNEMTPFKATKLVVKYFREKLDEESFNLISRINIVHTYDESVDAIYRAMHVSNNGIAYIKDCNFFGVFIKDAIILESHRE